MLAFGGKRGFPPSPSRGTVLGLGSRDCFHKHKTAYISTRLVNAYISTRLLA